MKKSKFSQEQIVFALNQHKQGVILEDTCWKIGASQAMAQAYGGLSSQDLRELRLLKEETFF